MLADKEVYTPSEREYSWTFGGNKPIAELDHYQLVKIFTEDCFVGRLQSEADLPSRIVKMPFLNPQTGPFFVRRAQPGDTLAVHIVDMQPARDWGVSCNIPLFGALTGTNITANLQTPLPERVWIYRRTANQLIFRAQDSGFETTLPLAPFHGTIGVAPPNLEVRNALVPDTFGGNMDTKEIRAGSTVFLGVNVPGALISMGDGHYAMGDGEACGVAVEGAMITTFTVDVIQGMYTPWPRIEREDRIMTVGSARPLEDAFRIAQLNLVRWIVDETNLSELDAYQLVSQASEVSIANVCDPNYTVVAGIPKRYFPSTEWMRGVRRALQKVAVLQT